MPLSTNLELYEVEMASLDEVWLQVVICAAATQTPWVYVCLHAMEREEVISREVMDPADP